jgi:hypothetical protein
MTKGPGEELRRVLEDWQAGRVTCRHVQHWAQATSLTDANAYVSKVVVNLRNLGEYLITVDDIPVYLEGLELPPEEAVNKLKDEGTRFDAKSRATDLRDDPFYGPHTRAILRDLR